MNSDKGILSPDETPDEETLGFDYVDGRNARRNGKQARDCPHRLSSPQGEAWVRGWRDRQAEEEQEKKPSELVVTIRTHDVHVCLKSEPGAWGAGHSINEALGDFVRTHYQKLAIKLTFPE